VADDGHGEEDKTEDASHRRLQQARDQGNLPIGRDLVGLAGFAAGCLTLLACGPALRDALITVVAASARALDTARAGELLPLLLRPALLALAVPTAVAVAAGVAGVAQTGGGFWPELTLPDPSRLFSGGKIKRLFGKEALADFGLALVKFVTVAATIWSALRVEFLLLPRLLGASTAGQLAGLFEPLAAALVKILAALAFLAGLDLAVTRFRYNRKLRMTKEEAKRDYKEEEGDPLFRSRRKRMHRDLLKGVAKAEVPKADALIVNPTHIAIAIRYRPDQDRAPRVTAKGKGVLAESMRDLARQHGIPIVENIPLARLLYRKVKVGRAVPAETYKAVAAVLAFVYRVLGRGQRDARGGAAGGLR
jgi:flagellar biosynthesis protein FlhB